MSNAVFPSLYKRVASVKVKAIFNNTSQGNPGRKKVVVNEIYPTWQYEINLPVMLNTADYFHAIQNFFLERRGSSETFLFDNALDNYCAEQQLGIGDDTTRSFQIIRPYFGAVGNFLEPVKNIKVSPFPRIFLDDVEQVFEASDSSALDSAGENSFYIEFVDSGLVIFDHAPGVGVVVKAKQFGYYQRCRFVEDISDFEKFQYNLWKGVVNLETVK